MTSILRASALALLFALGTAQASLADGRADWTGYAWQTIRLSECLASGTQLACPPHHQKWDWKRNQWVDLAIALDTSTGRVTLTQTLTDNDRADSDDVCVTAIIVDGGGNNLVAHHTNWHMEPTQVRSEGFSYRSSRLDQAAAIHIGSRQCRKGAHQDDAAYRSVLAGIKP
jgi:hypothetical protein